MINAMGSTSVDCQERTNIAPTDAGAPRSYTCRLPGTDLSELMLKEGWATVEPGATDLRYFQAAASARALKTGMWRRLPSDR
jgi:endonuclease YncB( thermonuclease family)